MSKENDVVESSILNVNIGILGHVDSGKTSLVKALSTCLSTAALDKHPQSAERGITIDLGFSAFTIPMPNEMKASVKGSYDLLQFTLVDCPGHASLIRTIIGGAQIIDAIVLVIDINKGIQTQTAECIVLGEITTNNMIIVLNKADLVPEEERAARIEKMTRRIKTVFSTTKFPDPPIVVTSAAVGGEKVAAVGAAHVRNGTDIVIQSHGIESLVVVLRSSIKVPTRNNDGPFLFAVDHCFAIKGHGTVLTGTVVSGSVTTNSMIELPELQQQRKVKSMQIFRRPVKFAGQGDRVGICVTGLDPHCVERGIVASPRTVTTHSNIVCLVRKVRFFKEELKSGSKVHVSIGHTTVVATVHFFGANELMALLHRVRTGRGTTPPSPPTTTTDTTAASRQGALNSSYFSNFPNIEYDWTQDFVYQDILCGAAGFASSSSSSSSLSSSSEGHREGSEHSYVAQPVQWALLQLQQPVMCPREGLVIGSRLDGEQHHISTSTSSTSGSSSATGTGPGHQCRLVFYGILKAALSDDEFHKLNIFRWKQKDARILRLTDVRNGRCYSLIAWQLVGAAAGLRPFIGMSVVTERGDVGLITSPFGSSGKFQVKFSGGAVGAEAGGLLVLRFKRYVYDKSKRMVPPLQVVTEGVVAYSDERTRLSPKSLETSSSLSLSVFSCGSPKQVSPTEVYSPWKEGDTHDSLSPPISPPAPLSVASASTLIAEGGADQFPTVPVTVTVPSLSVEIQTLTLDDGSVTLAVPVHEATVAAETNTAPPSTMEGCELRTGVIDSLREEMGDHIDARADGDRLYGQAIVSGAFRMEDNIRGYGAAVVRGPKGERGFLMGPFAKMGKCKVSFPEGVSGPIGGTVELFLPAASNTTTSTTTTTVTGLLPPTPPTVTITIS